MNERTIMFKDVNILFTNDDSLIPITIRTFFIVKFNIYKLFKTKILCNFFYCSLLVTKTIKPIDIIEFIFIEVFGCIYLAILFPMNQSR